MMRVEDKDAVPGGCPEIAGRIYLQPDDAVVVFIQRTVQPVIKVLKNTRIAVIKGQALLGADGQTVPRKSFQAIDIVVRDGIGLGTMVILYYFRAVIPVEPVG